MGLGKWLGDSVSQSISGEWDVRALELGELAQLLDRKWWRRVWIVKELVLAKKAIIPGEVPWEAIKTRMRDGVYGILGQEANQPVKQTEEGSVVAKRLFLIPITST